MKITYQIRGALSATASGSLSALGGTGEGGGFRVGRNRVGNLVEVAGAGLSLAPHRPADQFE
jgi:hypothetical protein